jgi:hypothetical protein
MILVLHREHCRVGDKFKYPVARTASGKTQPPMATSSRSGPSTRFLLIGQGQELADALKDSFGKSHEVVQAADFDEALGAIAEGGADVVLLPSAVDDPEAVRALGELLTALARKRI